MQSETAAGTAAATAGAAHTPELTADEVAQRLGDLEPEATIDAAAAEAGAVDTVVKAEQQPEQGGEAQPDEQVQQDEPPEARIPKERLDREIEKKRKAEERAQALETELSSVKAQADEQYVAAAAALGVHPDYLSAPERKEILRYNELTAQKGRLLEQWDGVEDDDPAKTRTAAQVRREFAEVDRELQGLAGRAGSVYERAKQEMIRDLKLVRQVRAQRAALKQASKSTAGKAGTLPPPVKPTSADARGPGSSGERTPDPMKLFREKGGKDSEAAAAFLSAI